MTICLAQGYFNAAALQAGAGPLWVCEGAFDALALLAAGVPRVVAIFGVQGWCWDWARDMRELVFALDADVAGQQQWQALARQAALRGKRVAVLPVAAYGGYKDVSEAWAAGVLARGDGPGARAQRSPRTGGRCGKSGSQSWSRTARCRAWRQSAWRGRGSSTRQREPPPQGMPGTRRQRRTEDAV